MMKKIILVTEVVLIFRKAQVTQEAVGR